MSKELLNLKRYYPLVKRTDTPLITISKKCLYFNKACKPHLNHRNYCELFYDEHERVMVVKPLMVETECSVRIVRAHRQQVEVNIRAFLLEFRLIALLGLYNDGIKSRRLMPKWDNKHKVFIIDFKKLESVGRGGI